MATLPSPLPGSSRTVRTYAQVVFGAGLTVSLLMIFVGWRAQHFVSESSDPYGYVAMARDLLQNGRFLHYGSVLNRRGPLYPAFIALVYSITGEQPLVMRILQALMLATVCLMTFDVGRRLFNPRTGLVAGLVCAFHPVLLRYVPDFHVEIFLLFLATLSLWRSVLFIQAPSVKNGALFGVCAALGALAKPVVLLYPVVFAGWWLLIDRKVWRGAEKAPSPEPSERVRPRIPAEWAAAAAIFVAMGVVILPWTYRNYRSSGRPVLITTGFGDAFLRGYIFSKTDYALLRLPPYVYAENESNTTFRALCRTAGTEWERDDIESERILTQAAKQKLLDDPAGFVRKFSVQLFTFWYQMTSLVNSLVAGVLALVLWALALVGWRRARTEGKPTWPLFLPIFTLNLSLAVLLALGRYSVPILPALAVLAAFGVDTLLSRRPSAPAAAEVP